MRFDAVALELIQGRTIYIAYEDTAAVVFYQIYDKGIRVEQYSKMLGEEPYFEAEGFDADSAELDNEWKFIDGRLKELDAYACPAQLGFIEGEDVARVFGPFTPENTIRFEYMILRCV